MRFLYLVAVLLLVACVPSNDAPAIPMVEISREGGDAILVTYHLQEGAYGLHFDAPDGGLRERTWEVLTEGFEFSRGDESRRLTWSGQGPVASQLAVRIPVGLMALPRKHEPVVKFSDGSFAVYTGYLAAHQLIGDVQVPVELGLPRDTYWYQGTIAAVEKDGISFRLDPALPSWVAFSIRQRLPRVLDHFTVGFGISWGTTVEVMVSYNADAGGYGLSGSVVNGVMQVSVFGSEWQNDDPWAAERLDRFLAHEAVHLWNSGLVRFRPGSPVWLYEGSADALAERALLHLGWIDEHRYSEMQSAALTVCQDTGDPYACGNARASKIACEVDYLEFWAALIDKALVNGGLYDEAAHDRLLTAFTSRAYTVATGPCDSCAEGGLAPGAPSCRCCPQGMSAR